MKTSTVRSFASWLCILAVAVAVILAAFKSPAGFLAAMLVAAFAGLIAMYFAAERVEGRREDGVWRDVHPPL